MLLHMVKTAAKVRENTYNGHVSNGRCSLVAKQYKEQQL